ncbi:hypothetical protein Tco_0974752 [Tanacetum coccineum]|uniref:Uncharacterized protein n=1 Tax=Tanacetum coccineum TaxID=301880 RepID=A0ABQ5ECF7_9ASTR
MCTTFASSYPPNKLETSSNPMHQVAMPERQTLSYVGNYSTGNDHIARQYTQSKKFAILADTGERFDYGPGTFTVKTNALFQSDGIDLYNLDYDEVPTAQASFMPNLSSCDSEVPSEVPYSNTYPNDMINQDVQEMPYFEQTHINDYPDNEINSDSNIIPYSKYLVIAKEHVVICLIDDEETLILEEESRSKMFDKQNDPISVKQKINISPIDYSKFNNLKEDFGKRFVTQRELSAEQAFWLKHSNYNPDTFVKLYTPVRIEAPIELPKVSLVNESLKKLKYHLASFNKVVKKRTISDAITAVAWGFEHTKACFLTEIIPFLKVLKDTFNAFDKTLLDEITEVQTIFNQMEAAIDQCFVDKNTFEIEKKELKLKNECLLEHIIYQDVVNIVMHADVKFDNVLPVPNTFLDDNIALDVMKMENDRLMELLVSQDLVHTAVHSLAVINDYQSIERSYVEEYEKNVKLAAKLSQMNELLKTCSRLE